MPLPPRLHNRTVPPAEAVKICVPSGLKPTLETAPACPPSTASSDRVATVHTWAVPSVPPEMTASLWRLNWAANTEPSWAPSFKGRPDLRHHGFAFFRGQRFDLAGQWRRSEGRDVPEADHAIVGAGDDPLPAWAKGRGPHGRGMLENGGNLQPFRGPKSEPCHPAMR